MQTPNVNSADGLVITSDLQSEQLLRALEQGGYLESNRDHVVFEISRRGFWWCKNFWPKSKYFRYFTGSVGPVTRTAPGQPPFKIF